MAEDPQPLTRPEWVRLRWLQPQKPPKMEEKDVSEQVDLESRQGVYVFHVISEAIATDLATLVEKVRDLADVEDIVQTFNPINLPETAPAIYAALPSLFEDCDKKRHAAAGYARRYRRVADEVEMLIKDLSSWLSHITAQDGPQWKIDAEFAACARPLLDFARKVVPLAKMCDSVVTTLDKRAMTLHAYKELSSG